MEAADKIEELTQRVFEMESQIKRLNSYIKCGGWPQTKGFRTKHDIDSPAKQMIISELEQYMNEI